MKNIFEKSVQKFRPPNQHIPKNTTQSNHRKTEIQQKNIPEKIRPFEAQFRAAKFTENLFVKNNLALQQSFKKISNPEKEEAALEDRIMMDSELLAYYFMELSEEQQDDLLVEHMIIVPDNFRKDLEKMSYFILKNKADGIDFVPIQEIFSLLKTI